MRCIGRYCCALMASLRMLQRFDRFFGCPFSPANGDGLACACGSNLCVVQVIKQRAAKPPRRVIGVIRRIACGTAQQVKILIKQTQSTKNAHVNYIERLNGTFRSRLAVLVRRGRGLARQLQTLEGAMYLMGCVYNLCTPHQSLRLMDALPNNRRRWVKRTPAMVAGAHGTGLDGGTGLLIKCHHRRGSPRAAGADLLQR